ncbi:MAG: uracil-DNA glycosylase family protein [Candidatus Kapaibacterium sp.]
MNTLLAQIRSCSVCAQHLPFGAHPVVRASALSKIVIVGQAPGRIVHHTGIPWNDRSGDTLRSWLGIDKSLFYDTNLFALMPMGFCYPGTGTSGDLPPRPECAPLWHEQLLACMPHVSLMLLVGHYAHAYYLRKTKKKTLADTVRHFHDYLPRFAVLPHPSPRNTLWLRKNDWFERDIISELRLLVQSRLDL